MNRTEHRIRMAFEPDYAEKYKEFVKKRNEIVKKNAESFLRIMLPALAGPTFLVVFLCMFKPEIMKQLLSFYLLILIPFILVPVFLTAGDIRRSKAAFYF
jgi:hypothetical protein